MWHVPMACGPFLFLLPKMHFSSVAHLNGSSLKTISSVDHLNESLDLPSAFRRYNSVYNEQASSGSVCFGAQMLANDADAALSMV